MIYPKHHKWYHYFFDHYVRYIIRKDFSRFQIKSDENQFPHALLVIANHFSWWDGFFHYQLNNELLKKQYHVMMLEEELSKRRFLTRLGVFGVKKGSRDSIRSLQFAKSLLDTPENMVLIFPQGKIESHHQQLFVFEKGVQYLITERTGAEVMLVASFIDSFYERKPAVTMYCRKAAAVTATTTIEAQYNAFFQECLREQKALFVK